MHRTSHQLPKVALTDELPFDVETERRAAWVDAASVAVVVTAAAAALRLVPLVATLPFLIASSVGRRFGSSALHVVVREDGNLELGGKLADPIHDVWLDDTNDPRVVVTHGQSHEQAVLWFDNREQAQRFARALGRKTEVVAGYRPRMLDLLTAARFVAIAIAFVASGSGSARWYGALALVFVPLALRGWLAAKQLVVHGDTFELHSALDHEAFSRDTIVSVDVDEGIIALKGEREVRFATTHSRDAHLTTPLWTDAIRRRALKLLATKYERAGETTDPSADADD